MIICTKTLLFTIISHSKPILVIIILFLNVIVDAVSDGTGTAPFQQIGLAIQTDTCMLIYVNA